MTSKELTVLVFGSEIIKEYFFSYEITANINNYFNTNIIREVGADLFFNYDKFTNKTILYQNYSYIYLFNKPETISINVIKLFMNGKNKDIIDKYNIIFSEEINPPHINKKYNIFPSKNDILKKREITGAPYLLYDKDYKMIDTFYISLHLNVEGDNKIPLSYNYFFNNHHNNGLSYKFCKENINFEYANYIRFHKKIHNCYYFDYEPLPIFIEKSDIIISSKSLSYFSVRYVIDNIDSINNRILNCDNIIKYINKKSTKYNNLSYFNYELSNKSFSEIGELYIIFLYKVWKSNFFNYYRNIRLPSVLFDYMKVNNFYHYDFFSIYFLTSNSYMDDDLIMINPDNKKTVWKNKFSCMLSMINLDNNLGSLDYVKTSEEELINKSVIRRMFS